MMQRRMMQARTRFALFHVGKVSSKNLLIGEKMKAPNPLPQTAIPVASDLFDSK